MKRELTLPPLEVDSIQIRERYRPLCEEHVRRLQASMAEIGLRNPISIIVIDLMMIDGQEHEGVPVLVAGRHRLEAARRLGWSHIACIDVGDDPLSAELWEIAENLHRLELTKEQRDQHIRRYAELLGAQARPDKLGQNDPVSAGGRGNKGVARQIADATGLSKKTVSRALTPPKPAGLVPAAVRPANPSPPVQPRLTQASEFKYRSLKLAWSRADKSARARFLQELAPAVSAQLSLFGRASK